jgi:hypothetical protein
VSLTVNLLVRQLRCDFHDTSAEPSKTKVGLFEAMKDANGTEPEYEHVRFDGGS